MRQDVFDLTYPQSVGQATSQHLARQMAYEKVLFFGLGRRTLTPLRRSAKLIAANFTPVVGGSFPKPEGAQASLTCSKCPRKTGHPT
jgi:hypothetical protein